MCVGLYSSTLGLHKGSRLPADGHNTERKGYDRWYYKVRKATPNSGVKLLEFSKKLL